MFASTRVRRARPLLLAVLSSVLLVLALPGTALAEPPRALAKDAAPRDARFQPALDYDTDGCYATPAIGRDGTIAPGLETTGALNGNCRDRSDLRNTNAYSRAQCDRESGWCAYMYAFYFEKDQVIPGAAPNPPDVAPGPDEIGHRHDLEHVVVWARGDRALYVSASAHGGFETRPASEVRFEGDHPKIVYHKDDPQTHALRFANADDDPPENHDHRWQYPALVSWNRFPKGIREKLVAADFGAATLALKNGQFTKDLGKAKPERVTFRIPASAEAAAAPE